ncbi:MAG: aminopeptidase P family protein [Candidatus Aminicenantes bacterium]|nr:MAG: aminopeptidase P family protein [Candidatus Aminicenantes bacterium]
MSKERKTVLLVSFLILALLPVLSGKEETPSILSMRERNAVVNNWLKIRLETVLPELMRREKFDMWVVICREYNEDPVFYSLVPYNSFAARRLTMLVFYDRGEKGVEKLAVSRYGIGDFYEGVWQPEKIEQWECLAKVIKERNPKRIGINESDTFAFGDGLSSSLKKKLLRILGPEYSSRLHSAEELAVGWLERRIPEELEVYPHIVAIAHQIITEAFSREVITPGVTTTQDVSWWIRERFRELRLGNWFHPSVSIQRSKKSKNNGDIILRGDLLHCDIGITYLRLNTDTQEHAYVLREGESDAPHGLKEALKLGNRLQDILIGEFKEGRTGNEILAAALKKAKEVGLKASIYSHPLGFHGHAAGPTIGLWDNQVNVPGKGDYRLYYNTCYAIELNIRTNLAEWGGQEIRIALEQDGAFTRKGVYFIDGRQTKLHIIK